MCINPCRRLCGLKRWLPLSGGLKKARESVAGVRWVRQTLRRVAGRKYSYAPVQKNKICSFAAQAQVWLVAHSVRASTRARTPVFYVFSIPNQQQQRGDMWNRLAEFSEMHSPFITFPSNGEPGWERGSHPIPSSLSLFECSSLIRAHALSKICFNYSHC